MAALTSGRYLAKTEREVVVWKAPDADGDGNTVWTTRTDAQGRSMERVLEKDPQGREIKEYLPPEGFQNRPGYDHTDNYVLVSERGEIVRQPNGEAVNIKPGQAIVLNPDGSMEILPDEYAQFVFGEAHDAADASDDTEKKASRKKAS